MPTQPIHKLDHINNIAISRSKYSNIFTYKSYIIDLQNFILIKIGGN